MQCLVVSFLRWGVTSCVMWALPICPSTPLCAAHLHQVVPPAAVDHPVLRDLLDRRAQAVLQARRVPVAPRDRAVAVVPQALDHQVDPEAAEAKDPPAKAAAREPVGLQDPAGALAVRAVRAVAAHQVQVVHREAPALPAARVHLDQVADPLVPHRGAAVRAVAGPVVRGVDQVANPVPARSLDRVQHHRAPAVAVLVDLDPAVQSPEVNPREAVTAAVLVQAAQHLVLDPGVVREPVAPDRAVVVTVLGAVVPPVHRVVVAVHASICGTGRVGHQYLLLIHVQRHKAHSKCFVVVEGTSPLTPVPLWDKLYTQDVNK
jgi:hypothetical protein